MVKTAKKRSGTGGASKQDKGRGRKTTRSGAGKSSSDSSARNDWKFGSVASDIVHRAASILEEEIAAGIVAAKQVESRFVRKAEVKDEAPRDDLMQRLRKDAHEAVDVFMDLFSTMSRNLSEMANRASAMAEKGKGEGSAEDSPETPEATSGGLRISTAQGAVGRATLRVRGAGPVAAMCEFVATDFVSESMHRLPASCVTFEPENAMLSVKTAADVEVILAVPSATPRGSYTGLIKWGTDESCRSVAEVVVG